MVDKRRIAAGAELLHERIQNGHTSTENQQTDKQPEFALEKLRTYTDTEDVERYVHFEQWPADENLPEWIQPFSDLLTHLSRVDTPVIPPDSFEDTFPFEEIFYQILTFATDKFVSNLDTPYVSAEGFGSLENHLMDQLVEIGGQALHIDFITYIAEHHPDSLRNDSRSPDSTKWYDEYIATFFDGRFESFFEEFPVLARLLVVVTRQWGVAVSQFILRLSNDHSSICANFEVEESDSVVQIDAGAGDSHAGGQTVFIVEFENGTEIVYKPRNLEIENQFYQFESWLSTELDSFPVLQTPMVISRPSYGWMELISAENFSEQTAVEEYYKRVGALLFVLYLLNTADCHFENIVAGESSPVVVDAETLFKTEIPFGSPAKLKPNQKLKEYTVRSSVLKTAMVPFAEESGGIPSGLSTINSQKSSIQRVDWTSINTDAIDIEYRNITISPEHNIPYYEGKPAPADLFVDEISDGFETAYEAVLNSQEKVKQKIDDQFSGLSARNVLQPTSLYQRLLNTLNNPEYLRDAVKHSQKVQKVLSKRTSEKAYVTQQGWQDLIKNAEQEALFRRDIPRFTVQTDVNGVYFDGNKIAENIFNATGMERVDERIAMLSKENKAYQQGLIRACLSSTNARSKQSEVNSNGTYSDN